MFKLERKINDNDFYEVMLSPFKSHEKILSYRSKYDRYFPSQKLTYKITNLETGQKTVIRY
jgi:hypothetical protein